MGGAPSSSRDVHIADFACQCGPRRGGAANIQLLSAPQSPQFERFSDLLLLPCLLSSHPSQGEPLVQTCSRKRDREVPDTTWQPPRKRKARRSRSHSSHRSHSNGGSSDSTLPASSPTTSHELYCSFRDQHHKLPRDENDLSPWARPHSTHRVQEIMPHDSGRHQRNNFGSWGRLHTTHRVLEDNMRRHPQDHGTAHVSRPHNRHKEHERASMHRQWFPCHA